MARKRIAACIGLLVLGMTARATVAAPKAAIIAARSVTCCAAHCPKSHGRPMAPRQCCFVDSAAGEPASIATTPTIERPAAAVTVVTRPEVRVAEPLLALARDSGGSRAGPPLYVQLRQLLR